MSGPRSLTTLAAELASRRVSSRGLVEDCLARIEDPSGEGATAFVSVSRERALAAADAIDHARRLGVAPSPFAGIPISVKDLFDVAGEPTRAGSRVLAQAAPAAADAPVIARLRAAGLIIVGRTNMTEFAYSGLGLNPHYGTPRNPFDRASGRIPGGSSSGAAVSVADAMAAAGLGTDTGGSCRIPAALTGLAGFKPTARRVPRAGVLPLSPTLDSVGSIAPTISCCAVIDAIAAGERPLAPQPFPLAGLRFAVPQSLVLEDMDASVARDFARATGMLSAAGARVSDLPLPELLDLPALNAKGGLVAAEAFAWHRSLLAARAPDYDPRVRMRIEKGAEQDASDYITLCIARTDFIERVTAQCALFDALIMPTVPHIAPTIAELEDDDAYARANLLMLRNPAVVNFLDGCAASVPCHRAGDAPAGLMVSGLGGTDSRTLAIAQAVEALLAPLRG